MKKKSKSKFRLVFVWFSILSWREKGHEPSRAELKILQLEFWLKPARLGLITNIQHLFIKLEDAKLCAFNFSLVIRSIRLNYLHIWFVFSNWNQAFWLSSEPNCKGENILATSCNKLFLPYLFIDLKYKWEELCQP